MTGRFLNLKPHKPATDDDLKIDCSMHPVVVSLRQFDWAVCESLLCLKRNFEMHCKWHKHGCIRSRIVSHRDKRLKDVSSQVKRLRAEKSAVLLQCAVRGHIAKSM